ncbi:MAG: CCA tRNA nucleotidyltransferase [Thermoproteota archaeon]|jgi:tRNA nucleotidyltransferase (CCA-adding enzyme)|nr:CCA tRNA nucleotidyltransferase [Thermoproteota archaeon]
MSSASSVIMQASKYCEPSAVEEKKLTSVAVHVMQLVSRFRSPHVVDIVAGGSFAKGTWIKGDVDLDIFVRIRPSVDKEEFERLGKSIGLQTLGNYETRIRYSEHPYVEAFVRKVRVNIVPCYDVEKGKWRSAADRSPFHTEYILGKMNHQMKKEVRLLKKFLKSVGVYGSEIAKGGISGYVTEILVLKYGSFISTLQAIADITKERQVISIGEVDKDILKTFQSKIIIIDPIDHRRNLGAAISAESLAKFILAARAFIHRPSLEFFSTMKKRTPRRSKLYSNLLIVEFKYRDRSPDTIWGQLKRTLSSLSKQLKLAHFNVIRATCITDEAGIAGFVFLLQSVKLPNYFERTGPEVFRKKESFEFISKNSKDSLLFWTNEEMRIIGLFKTRVTDAVNYLRLLFREGSQGVGITRGLREDLQNGTLRIYTGKERGIKGIVKDAVNEVITTELFISQS